MHSAIHKLIGLNIHVEGYPYTYRAIQIRIQLYMYVDGYAYKNLHSHIRLHFLHKENLYFRDCCITDTVRCRSIR
jgi:hypothetical protein